MKTLIITAAVFVALAGPIAASASARAPVTVAVYNFTGDGRNTGDYGGKITTLVTADLTTETNLIMVERSQLKKALGEQSLDSSGMVSSATAAKIGQITGAKVLVSGHVIMTEPNRLVVVANIVGTETARLFAVQVEGSTGNLMDLANDLSRKIARKIQEQYSNFAVEKKSREEYLDRLVRSVTGTNRPTVSVNIYWPQGPKAPCISANTEMGVILQKAGFEVVDAKSERKPDVIITGRIETDKGPREGHLYSTHAVIDVKIQERETGKIIAFDHQTADAADIGQSGARKSAAAAATDGLAERILPLLAK